MTSRHPPSALPRRDIEGAVERFLEGSAAPAAAAHSSGLPGAIAAAFTDSGAFFEDELPEVQRWPFTGDDAARVTQPALLG